MASIFMLMFFAFRDISNWFGKMTAIDEKYLDWWVLSLVCLVMIMCGFVVAKRIRDHHEMNLFFNILSVLLLSYSLYSLVIHIADFGIVSGGGPRTPKPPQVVTNINDENLPDVYYIILDGYGSQDVLKKYYNLDNRDFIDELNKLGFYVASESNTNYIQTSLSLCSSLNFDYIKSIRIEERRIRKRSQLFNCIRDSQVRRTLSARGYQTVAFQTPYEFISLSDADIFYESSRPSKFAGLVLDVTLARVLRRTETVKNRLYSLPYQEHRKIILSIFEHLKDVPHMKGSFFVFAHVIAPHPPFVFDETGPISEFSTPFTLGDASDYVDSHSRQAYLEGYRGQLLYINGLVLDTISAILDQSENPPIIIIQGDHGPGAYLNWESLQDSKLDERFGILNAYYFPRNMYDNLYPSISPVNSFRIVLNSYFGEEQALLADRHYFSTWSDPLKFIEVDLK